MTGDGDETAAGGTESQAGDADGAAGAQISGDWDARRLCPDEGCIGVLTAEGRCPICGRQGERPPATAHRSQTAGVDDEEQPSEGGDSPSDTASSRGDDGAQDRDRDSDADDLDRRELCSDDACIGVLGPDGACKVCGKRP